MKKPSKSYLRNQCDALLTPLTKELQPHCFFCGKRTEVGHHFVHRSKSTALRYEMENLIGLCNSCHFALHQNESYYAAKIVERKGIEWFQRLERMKNVIVKADVLFYKQKLEKLKALIK